MNDFSFETSFFKKNIGKFQWMKFILLLIDEMYFKDKIQYIYCITEKYIILHTHTHAHIMY